MIHEIKKLLEDSNCTAQQVRDLIVAEEKARDDRMAAYREAVDKLGWDNLAYTGEIRLAYDCEEQGTVIRRVYREQDKQLVVTELVIRDGESNLYEKELDALKALPHHFVTSSSNITPHYASFNSYHSFRVAPEVLTIIQAIRDDMAKRRAWAITRREVLLRLSALQDAYPDDDRSTYVLALTPEDRSYLDNDLDAAGCYWSSELHVFPHLKKSQAWSKARLQAVQRIDKMLTDTFEGDLCGQLRNALAITPEDEQHLVKAGAERYRGYYEYAGFKVYVVASLEKSEMWSAQKVEEFLATKNTDILQRIYELVRPYQSCETATFSLVLTPADETAFIKAMKYTGGLQKHLGFDVYMVASLEKSEMWPNKKVEEFFSVAAG